MSILICPVCKEKLNKCGSLLRCSNNHSFDYAKEGYVNLLLGSKSGDKKGDSRDSARARHKFLDKEYFSCLKNYIVSKMSGTVLDICCGEGYYDDYNGTLFGFDISKEMVRLASKRNKNHNYFVANLSSIPIEDECIDTAIHLFAPFNEKEFSRVLKKGGRLYSVSAGENHLWEMKQIIYDRPYKNDECPPETSVLKLVSKTRLTDIIRIDKENLITLFSMTPYYYRTSKEDREKLNSVNTLDLTVDFIIFEFMKEE